MAVSHRASAANNLTRRGDVAVKATYCGPFARDHMDKSVWTPLLGALLQTTQNTGKERRDGQAPEPPGIKVGNKHSCA